MGVGAGLFVAGLALVAPGTRRPDVVVVVGAAVGQGQAVVDLDVGGRVPAGAEPADSTPLPVDFPAEPLGPTPSAAHPALAVADRPGVPSLANLAVTRGAPGASWLGESVAVQTRPSELLHVEPCVEREPRDRASKGRRITLDPRWVSSLTNDMSVDRRKLRGDPRKRPSLGGARWRGGRSVWTPRLGFDLGGGVGGRHGSTSPSWLHPGVRRRRQRHVPRPPPR